MIGYILFELLTSLCELLQFARHILASVVLVVQQLLSEHFKGLEGSRAGVDLCTVLLLENSQASH